MKKAKKLLSCLLVAFIVLTSSAYALSDIENASNDSVGEEVWYDSIYLKPLTSSNKYNLGETIEYSYEVASFFDVENYIIVCETENVNLISNSNISVDTSIDNIITVAFSTDSELLGTIKLHIYAYKNDELIGRGKTSFLYCRSYGDSVYVSRNAADEINYMINDEYNIADDVIVTDTIIKNDAETAAYVSFDITGTVKWTDYNGALHPANGAKVEIYTYNSSQVAALTHTLTTDSSGTYSATISGNTFLEENLEYFIKVYASGANVKVVNNEGNVYYMQSATLIGSNFSSIVPVIVFDNSSLVGKSMSVHQAMQMANSYMKTLEGSYLNEIQVVFPHQGVTNFSLTTGKISVLEADAFDWDVLQHEFGHYVMYSKGIDLQGGTHSGLLNLADAYENKSTGIRLAWTEGWATYFAINLQKEMNASNLLIPNVGDTSYSDTEDANIVFDIENLPSERNLGEANEATISAILYDLTDPASSNDYDDVWLVSGELWDIIKSNYCETLSDCITGIYNARYEMSVKLAIGKTLSYFKVAALLDDSPTGLSTNTPSFSWSNQGGSSMFPNNSFQVAFYDASYNLILTTASTTSSTITLSSTQWSQIENSSGDYFYCCVETSQTSLPITGEYYSNLICTYKS